MIKTVKKRPKGFYKCPEKLDRIINLCNLLPSEKEMDEILEELNVLVIQTQEVRRDAEKIGGLVTVPQHWECLEQDELKIRMKENYMFLSEFGKLTNDLQFQQTNTELFIENILAKKFVPKVVEFVTNFSTDIFMLPGYMIAVFRLSELAEARNIFKRIAVYFDQESLFKKVRDHFGFQKLGLDPLLFNFTGVGILSTQIIPYLNMETETVEKYESPISAIFNEDFSFTNIRLCKKCGNLMWATREKSKFCSDDCASSSRSKKYYERNKTKIKIKRKKSYENKLEIEKKEKSEEEIIEWLSRTDRKNFQNQDFSKK